MSLEIILDLISLVVWLGMFGNLMYERLKKPTKTWRDYADMGLLIIFSLIYIFIVWITSFS
jgi:hypothetical protein